MTAVREFKPKGVILSGGPESVTTPNSPRVPEAVWELGVPVLGICYGMQAMAQKFGGIVEPHDNKEFGYAEIRARGHSKLLERHRRPGECRRPRPARCLDVAR